MSATAQHWSCDSSHSLLYNGLLALTLYKCPSPLLVGPVLTSIVLAPLLRSVRVRPNTASCYRLYIGSGKTRKREYLDSFELAFVDMEEVAGENAPVSDAKVSTGWRYSVARKHAQQQLQLVLTSRTPHRCKQIGVNPLGSICFCAFVKCGLQTQRGVSSQQTCTIKTLSANW